MKFIFDFDDVLFNTKKFKELLYKHMDKLDASNVYYEKIMQECPNLVNSSLVEIIQKLNKKNCFIVTFGDKEFQTDKIKRSGMWSLFSEIVIVQSSKKETIEKICAKHRNESVFFIDDKVQNFEDLDFKKYPNLKTILYDEQGLEKLTSILS